MIKGSRNENEEFKDSEPPLQGMPDQAATMRHVEGADLVAGHWYTFRGRTWQPDAGYCGRASAESQLVQGLKNHDEDYVSHVFSKQHRHIYWISDGTSWQRYVRTLKEFCILKKKKNAIRVGGSNAAKHVGQIPNHLHSYGDNVRL